MDIDRDAPATAEGEILIAAPIETVWAVLTDLEAWPAWNPDVTSMALEGPLAPGSTFRWKAGSASLSSTLQVVEPPREVGWTGTTMGISAIHVFHLETTDGGTRVRSAESFRGLIPSVFRRYSGSVLQRGIDSILASLKVEAEREARRQRTDIADCPWLRCAGVTRRSASAVGPRWPTASRWGSLRGGSRASMRTHPGTP